MTLEEYNNLTNEEQNALVATEVMEWMNSSGNWLLKDGVTFLGYQDHYSSPDDFPEFDPINNLDHALMGVYPLLPTHYFRLRHTNTNIGGKGHWIAQLNSEHGFAETPNEAIMLVCFRVKGVVSD